MEMYYLLRPSESSAVGLGVLPPVIEMPRGSLLGNSGIGALQAPTLSLLDTIQTGKGSFSGLLKGTLVHFHGINDVYGVAELEALGSSLIETHECGTRPGRLAARRAAPDASGQL
jgi:hypothetical protein